VSGRLELLRLHQSEWRSLGDDPVSFAQEHGLQLGEEAGRLREVANGTVAFLTRLGSETRWGSFLAVDSDSQLVVGTCAYKGPPDADGAVEIAYFTFPPYEGRGYATAMASLLTLRAGETPPARTVRAHTLRERNASVAILQKLGFTHLGEVMDPEDGPVWRWERGPGPSTA
jgi:ribosomal-protein-alanine N-acetyltransferase